MFWDERFLVEARVNERAWRFTDLISNAEDKRFVRRVLQRPGDDDSRFIAVGYHGPREDSATQREKVQVLVSDFMTISQRDDMGRAPVLFAGDWNLDAETVDACFRQALRGSDYDHAPYYQRADGGADEGPARFTTGGNQPLDHFWVIWHRDDGGRVRDILGLQAPKVHYSQRADDFAGREYYMLWRPDRKLNHYPVTVEAHGLLAGATPAAGQNIDLSAIEERLERIEGILNDIPQRLISALRNQGIVLQAGGGRGRGSGDGPEVSPGGDAVLSVTDLFLRSYHVTFDENAVYTVRAFLDSLQFWLDENHMEKTHSRNPDAMKFSLDKFGCKMGVANVTHVDGTTERMEIVVGVRLKMEEPLVISSFEM